MDSGKFLIVGFKLPNKEGEWGNLRALVDVKIGNMIIRNFRVIQKPDSKPYVTPPQSMYIQEGQKNFVQIVLFDDEIFWETLKREILRQYERLIGEAMRNETTIKKPVQL